MESCKVYNTLLFEGFELLCLILKIVNWGFQEIKAKTAFN